MANELVGGLTPNEALSLWTGVFGTGFGGAVILALITWLRARAESDKPPPMLSAEGQQAMGGGLSDKHTVEQIERIHVVMSHLNVDVDQVKEGLSGLAGSMERVLVAASRYHTENLDRLRQLTVTVEAGIDAQRATRRLIEDLQERQNRMDGQ